ncbi:MAG: hypothetical protein ACI9WS_002432 [Paraglaciecola psychrophila]
MRSRTGRREFQEASISFLDVISCGFGAIVLLLIIARIGDPEGIEPVLLIDGDVQMLQKMLFELRSDSAERQRDMDSGDQRLAADRLRLLQLSERLAAAQRQLSAEKSDATKESAQLQLALQMLTEEMDRLLGQNYQSQNQVIGGIPVDSEYIIFVVDTSGSMYAAAWERVKQEMVNILDIYPQVKGLQIMNDMGNYMYADYRGQWLQDSPESRKDIVRRLDRWQPFSNSSPVEGIQQAIRTFYDPDKKISIYVFGDDFSGNSIRRVAETVATLNKAKGGERLVRIHAIGFPVHYQGTPSRSAIRFAALMRELSYQNGGTFVGLNSLTKD